MNGYMVYALSTLSDTKYTAFSSEAWMKAAEVAIVGMLMIFSVLAILWGVLALFKLIFAPQSKEKKAPKVEEKTVSEPVAVEENTVAEVAPATTSNDAELIAVITAAIAAYRASEGLEGAAINGFRVVSFKRANAKRAWNSNKR